MTKLTVLMAAYNSERFLREALDSVLRQTCRNFNFLVVDDASTDGTGGILAKYAEKDNRIRVMRNEKNLGLPESLNRGLSFINTPLVARMDADDIALPQRFALQLARFDAQPDLAVLGGSVFLISEKGKKLGCPLEYPLSHDAVCAALWAHDISLAHPAVMFRTEAVKTAGGYRSVIRYAEDYDLWLRLTEAGTLGNLRESVLLYRQSSSTISATKAQEQALSVALAWISAYCRREGLADPASAWPRLPSVEECVVLFKEYGQEAHAFLVRLGLAMPQITAVLQDVVLVASALERELSLKEVSLLVQRGGRLPEHVPAQYLERLAPLYVQDKSTQYLAAKLLREVGLRMRKRIRAAGLLGR